MYYPTKRGLFHFFIIWGTIVMLAGTYVIDILTGTFQIDKFSNMLGLFVVLVVIVFLLWMWFGTGYTIVDGQIIIRSGPFKTTIVIHEIKHIKKVKSLISAFALSFDRIEIVFSLYESTHISPVNEENFIEKLLEENPSIKIDK